MENSWECDDCIHKFVCEHRKTMMALQNELYNSLQHTRFTASDRFVIGPKLEDLEFIKTVKIECKHFM